MTGNVCAAAHSLRALAYCCRRHGAREVPAGRHCDDADWPLSPAKTARGGCDREQLVNRVLLLDWGRPPRESYPPIPAEVILTSAQHNQGSTRGGLTILLQEEHPRVAGGGNDRRKLENLPATPRCGQVSSAGVPKSVVKRYAVCGGRSTRAVTRSTTEASQLVPAPPPRPSVVPVRSRRRRRR